MKTLICTFREGGATIAAIHKIEPQKLILLIPKEKDSLREDSLVEIKEKFKNNLKIETVSIENYDIPKITETICKVIDKQTGEIHIHMSESRKPQALAALFAGFIKRDKVEQVFYIEQETNSMLPMPLLSFKLSATKTKILKGIEKGNTDITKIIEKTKKSKTLIYNNIKQLKKQGYLTKDLKLTSAGKICVI